MTKESQPHDDIASVENSAGWSIGLDRLAAEAETELLRLFGAELEVGYAQIIEELFPDHLKSLVDKLDAAMRGRE
jgi:hypothetical protein